MKELLTESSVLYINGIRANAEDRWGLYWGLEYGSAKIRRMSAKYSAGRLTVEVEVAA